MVNSSLCLSFEAPKQQIVHETAVLKLYLLPFIIPEFVFGNVYGAQEPIPPAFVAWRAGERIRVVVPARQAGNRFLGSLKGLQIRAPV